MGSQKETGTKGLVPLQWIKNKISGKGKVAKKNSLAENSGASTSSGVP